MERKTIQTTSASLHFMAMLFMLCDHVWGILLTGNDWLTAIGRLAFPIYAFLIVEGYFHTKSLKRYMTRLLVFALISEIPFNLAIGGSLISPLYQNVLFTFLIALSLIWINEQARKKGKIWLSVLTGIGTTLLGMLLGLVTFVDYHHAGILTVLVFYFFRGRKWYHYLLQFVCLAYINLEMLGGLSYVIELFGREVWIPQQGFALLALIPIFLYRGKQGIHSRLLQYSRYAFYPGHLLLLWGIHTLMVFCLN